MDDIWLIELKTILFLVFPFQPINVYVKRDKTKLMTILRLAVLSEMFSLKGKPNHICYIVKSPELHHSPQNKKTLRKIV